MPEIVLPATVPTRARVFPDGVPEATVNPNFPLIWPLKFPLRVKEPVSVCPATKHGELEVNLKFRTVTEPSLFCWSEVPKAKTVELLLASKVAFQVPLIEFELFEPHPAAIRPSTTTVTSAHCFIREIPRV